MSAEPLDLDELVEHWTLLDGDRELVAGKRGGGRLAFALMLKFYARHGRFPDDHADLPGDVVEFVARQVLVAPEAVRGYEFSGRTSEYHRAQIRQHFGFRECTVEDARGLQGWLVEHVAEADPRAEVVRDELFDRCRKWRVEPPSEGRVERIVRAAIHGAQTAVCERIVARLSAESITRIEQLLLVADAGDGETESVLALIKSAPGNVSLETMFVEIEKLEAVRAVGLPVGLFSDVTPRVLAGWRQRASVESPSHLREHPRALGLTLLAALLWARERELTDTLVDLLISTVHRIGARAQNKVTNELIGEFKRIANKETLLFRVAEASVSRPDDLVKEVVFPVVGGEQALLDLVAEYKSSGPTYRRTVQTKLRASYSHHYRRGLTRLVRTLEFRSNNTVHRPVLDALELVSRYARREHLTYYPAGETIPTHAGVDADWRALAYKQDGRGRERVVRQIYEIATFQALRDQLRCKEIWVVGADRWRNPDEDLPQDFEQRRGEHYKALQKPLDPAEFIDEVRTEMQAELQLLHEALPGLPFLEIADRGKQGAIKLTPLHAQADPPNLNALKRDVLARWGMVALIDMLKESILRTGCLSLVGDLAKSARLTPETLTERLMLVIYGYGTNIGIRGVAAGDHAHTEDDLRYVRRWFLTPELVRSFAIEIANAAFSVRDPAIWGQASSTVASDSKHIGALDQNLFTEWHARYRKPGVLIYWHVEKKSIAIHSQLISCSASEVAAMIDGAMRHGTMMDVEGNYTDTHGQSQIAFGITRLLGFLLLPRIKGLNHAKLYQTGRGDRALYPGLTPALFRPIRWDRIAAQYDQMIKYATAIRTRTAQTEAILRRFMQTNAIHPTYQAMIELGRAQKTIFLCRYLRDRDLQHEIQEGLNVVEAWHRGVQLIFFGGGGDIPSNRREEQELSVLCLRVLQAAMVYINTLMLQDILHQPAWTEQLTTEDRRGITPLIWAHVVPHGEIRLDMGRRLELPE
jgi:TnpA family transposase